MKKTIKIIAYIFIVTLIIIGIIANIPANNSVSIKPVVTTTKIKYSSFKTIKNKNYQTYTIDISEFGTKYYKLNNDFEIKVSSSFEEIIKNIKISINDTYILDEEISDDSIAFYLYNDTIIYEKSDLEEDWNKKVYFINKEGKIIHEIYELDTISGMHPKEIVLDNNGITVYGTRIKKNSLDVINYEGTNYDVCNENQIVPFTDELKIEEVIKYPYTNKQISLDKQVISTQTINDYCNKKTE